MSAPLPPGSTGLPVLGETLEWRADRLAFLRRRWRRYGRIWKSATYGQREITMLGPEANAFILSTHRRHFEWAGGHEIFFDRRLFGDSIFLMDGDEHIHQRGLVLPAFHGRALRGYGGAIRALCAEYAARWAARGEIVLTDELKQLTFEVAAKLLLGAETREQSAWLSRAFDAFGRGMTAFPRWRTPWSTYGRAFRARDALREYFRALLARRRAAPGTDALGMLMTAEDGAGRRLEDERIVSHLIALLLAAHDTTRSAMTWLLVELDRHPEVVERLRAELAGAGPGAAVYEVLGGLEYLDRVLKEVERLHPPISGAPRRVVEPFDFDGCHVPAGWRVYYSILFTHMMPEIWSEPERFDPDRFAPPRSEDDKTPFSLIGFGAGPRSCIGRGFARLEMKVMAAVLVQGYELRVLPDQDLRYDYTPTRVPRGELRVRVTKRA